MQLTKSTITQILELIRTAYDNAFAGKSESDMYNLVELWYDCLQEYPYELVLKATKNAIKHCEFTPRIANIVSEIEKLTQADCKTDVELWAELEEAFYPVYRAVLYLRYPQYHKWASDKINGIYEKLSNEIKLFVVNTSTLRELAELANRADDDSIKFEKARFLKAMPELKAKQINRAQAQQFLQLCEAKGIDLIGSSNNGN